ncbi:hypothetical protein [Streptomyces sp. NPDC047315]|uniref:hypothetical protein n=1 Tax=Streptomyces sp. NPDC047315 TaxID=3155142 RepID=UPI0033D66C2F
MSDFAKGIAALSSFQSKVNGILADLNKGAGGKTAISEQRIPRGALSGGNAPFAEADGLFTQYSRVQQALTDLSRDLGLQIEALNIAVHASDVGTNNVDEERRRRFAEIEALLDRPKSYDKDSGVPDGKKTVQDKSSGSGWS